MCKNNDIRGKVSIKKSVSCETFQEILESWTNLPNISIIQQCLGKSFTRTGGLRRMNTCSTWYEELVRRDSIFPKAKLYANTFVIIVRKESWWSLSRRFIHFCRILKLSVENAPHP